MNIGDKVRFLSEVGGGRVSGFQGKDIVLVEDEDGFEIPMLRKEVVVVDDDDYDIGKVNTGTHTATSKGAKEPKHQPKAEEVEWEPADKPITFKPKAQERKGGRPAEPLSEFPACQREGDFLHHLRGLPGE